MLVNDFFNLCKVGVTKQFVLDEPAMFAYLNLALTEVYKKFDISMQEQIITAQSTMNEYQLVSDVMVVSAVYTDAKYLEHSGQYGTSAIDTVSSLAAYSTATIASLPINDDNDPNSVYTPNTGILVIPYPKDSQLLSVIYKASPKVYTSEDLESELLIEAQYISPMVMYVGYLANLGLETGQGQSMLLLTMFNQACAEIVNHGLHSTNVVVNDKLSMRGFV